MIGGQDADGGRWTPAAGRDPEPRPEWRRAQPADTESVILLRAEPVRPAPPASPLLPVLRAVAWLGLACGCSPILIYRMAMTTQFGPLFGLIMLVGFAPLLLALFLGLLLTIPLPVASLLTLRSRTYRHPGPVGLLLDVVPLLAAILIACMLVEASDSLLGSVRRARY